MESHLAQLGFRGGSSGGYDLAPLVAEIDVEVLSRHLTEVMLEEVYGDVVEPEVLRPLLMSSTVTKLECLRDLLTGAVTLDELEVPAAALAFAEEVGRQGIPEQMLERSYRVGIEALWAVWMEIVERHCDQTDDSAVEVVRASMPILFGFVDQMLFASLASYHAAVAARHQTREYRRARLVEQILDGTLTEPGQDTERFIGYSLAAHHLVAVTDDGAFDRQQGLVERLRHACRAGEVLVLDRGGSHAELWLGLTEPPATATRAALEREVAAVGRRVAFGEVKQGLEGFRAATISARDAATVQAMLADNAPQVLWAQDALIERLALTNPDGARNLVASVLGSALEEGLLTTRVRETLDAWLVTGSYVSAAASLGVHEQTVRQRLRRLEDAIGHSLHSQRTELHVALRLSHLTFPPDPRGHSIPSGPSSAPARN